MRLKVWREGKPVAVECDPGKTPTDRVMDRAPEMTLKILGRSLRRAHVILRRLQREFKEWALEIHGEGGRPKVKDWTGHLPLKDAIDELTVLRKELRDRTTPKR
jgi:hypothetical protein